MTEILALDVATTLGWARGRVGGDPVCGSIKLGRKGSSQLAICGNALGWAIDTIKPPLPDIVAIERLLPPSVLKQRSTEAHELLAFLQGIVMGVCMRRGVYKVHRHAVGSVRAHFLHGIPYKGREQAKAVTVEKCKSLGWLEVDDNDAADACALWSYQVGLLDGEQAIRISPLFGKVRCA